MRSVRQVTPQASSRQEEGEFALAAKAVDGLGAALDLRHDPSDEESSEQRDGFVDQHRASEKVSLESLWWVGG